MNEIEIIRHVLFYLVLGLALVWSLSHTFPKKDDDRW